MNSYLREFKIIFAYRYQFLRSFKFKYRLISNK